MFDETENVFILSDADWNLITWNSCSLGRQQIDNGNYFVNEKYWKRQKNEYKKLNRICRSIVSISNRKNMKVFFPLVRFALR